LRRAADTLTSPGHSTFEDTMVYEEESGDITMALVGDSFITRRLSPYREEGFVGLARLLRDADFSLSNAEVLFHRYEGAPIADAGVYGTYAAADPDLIDELKWLGIRMVACANNHAGDFGETGVVKNIEYLDRHGMPHAGTGRTLSEAAAPEYLDTPRGRVALVSVTATLPSGNQRAGDPLGVTRGRAGANVLRQEVTYSVNLSDFEVLQRLGRELRIPNRSPAADELRFLGERFVRGEASQRSGVANGFDAELNLKWVRDARRMADWVVVSIHCHEGGPQPGQLPEFVRDFARACIDAGADVVHGHGPHQDRAIEIYNGKPIFHALGNFIMQNDLVKWEPRDAFLRLGLSPDSTPADMYDHRTSNDTKGSPTRPIEWQTAVAEVMFRAHELAEIRLHPVDLGLASGKRSMRGRPVLAAGAVADEVIDRFQTYSAPLGTRVERDGGCALIMP
jgi:poly-gamma-glutamate synthesis protein (capsule biosynthesis protein)